MFENGDIMFKDYDKYLSTSLKLYSFVLLFVVILKIVGFDYFGMDLSDPALLNLNDFIMKYHLENVWYAISLYINVYIVISITTNDNSRKLKLYTLCCMPIVGLLQYFKTGSLITIIVDYFYVLILSFIYLKICKRKIKKENIANYFIFFIIINTLFQLISIFLRKGNVEVLMDKFVINFIYNLDYFIMLIIFYKLYFRKGVTSICTTVVYYFSQKLTSLKRFQTNLLKKSQNNKKKKEKEKKEKDKVEVLSDRIFIILSIFWNLFTLVLIVLIAMINDTVIECIFITFSFWITKTVFGKAFHFNNVLYCFIISNVTYYLLNKITTPLGISIFIPILLGVGLSYFTSKFVKKSYKPLYRGMPEELFNETIINVVEKDSLKYKICYDFYILKESDLSLSFKYNYSVAGIRKIKERVNEKIKRL